MKTITQDKIEKGATVYLIDGQECVYEGEIGGKHLVRQVLETEEGEELSDIIIAQGVFLSPPTVKLADEVRELNDRLTDLRAEAANLHKEISESQRSRKAILTVISQEKGLERIADFIAGRITHAMVVDRGEARIQTLESVLKMRNEYGRDKAIKLITLFGQSRGSLEFKINEYQDGSGTNQTIFLFTSEADAAEALRSWVSSKWDEWRTGKIKEYYLGNAIESAAAGGIEIPADVKLAFSEHVRRGKEEVVNRARAELEKAEKSLMEHEAAQSGK